MCLRSAKQQIQSLLAAKISLCTNFRFLLHRKINGLLISGSDKQEVRNFTAVKRKKLRHIRSSRALKFESVQTFATQLVGGGGDSADARVGGAARLFQPWMD